jgi:predicted  nucleic acid-binding Zn-ribbon protein
MHKLSRTMLTLKKRTATLRTLIRQSASAYRLHKAAVKVRDARIRVLLAKIGELSPALFTERENKRIAALSSQIESLRQMTPAEFLAAFQRAQDASEGS